MIWANGNIMTNNTTTSSYTSAFSNGYIASDKINDAPIVFEDSNLESSWRPENYTGKFYGPIRLREALVQSVNLVSIKLLREMGISNTTSASAISCALFDEPVESMTGIGTGLNKKQLASKISLIKSALKLHGSKFTSTLKILSCFGGREIAAIAGSIISARLKCVPVLLDGVICTAAASSLILFDKNLLDHCLISHLSTEPGHLKILSYLKKEPILDLNLRLGEGSGAAIASLILKSALVTHNGMSTFSDANVTNKNYS